MTWQLLQTIILLCQTNGGGTPYKNVRYQVGCVRQYVECFEKTRGTVIIDGAPMLISCIKTVEVTP